VAIRRVPQTYATVAAAVAAASSGDTILIDAGYAGNESVDVTVSGLTFDAPASVTGIVLTAASAGLTIALAGASAITVNGSAGNDVISGNGGANVIGNGGGGTDTLSGGAGNDTFQLLDGGEMFYPDGGAGTVDGGAGIDTVRSNDLGDFSFGNVEVLDVAYAPSTFNQLVFATVAQLASFGTITSSDGNPTNRVRLILRGAGGTLDLSTFSFGGYRSPAVTTYGIESAITVIGTAGDDLIGGSEFDDSLFGGDGNDYLGGSPGADLLDGGNGDDSIDVGSANIARGGAGSDTFRLPAGSGTGRTAERAQLHQCRGSGGELELRCHHG
jgi:Ca2+-binding RTX toxin-like protein